MELGSMTRAAEQLHVAQPALGAQVRQLEEELGTPLLRRHSRGVAVTAAGQVLYERAQQIVELVAETTREMAAFQTSQQETIRLGLSPSVVHLAAADMLVRAHATMPNVSLRLVEEPSLVLFDALKRGELDMLLAHEIPDSPGVTRTPWLREKLLFATASPPDAQPMVRSSRDIVDTISLAEALETDLALPLRRDGVRRIIETAAEPLKIKPRIAFQVQSPQALKILIVDQRIASILPYGLAFPELRTGALVARRIVAPALERTLFCARTDRRLSAANEVALAELLDSVRLRLFDLLGTLATPIDSGWINLPSHLS
ncbi:MAG: LysR family transcriptional regulator [Herbaspirillum sp.]|nr:LysR family transcriptional regulator [Herbaspirillum sp.]MCP3949022.1 LysR family transcriptional regulator [Herbaspirillum sp.]MCP4030448.1 LysR family transcriptional regulator [Herbaspirillum sp.]MCP4557800.1 LysR family transcriptional regulator [Herbaspirillum sp.]